MNIVSKKKALKTIILTLDFGIPGSLKNSTLGPSTVLTILGMLTNFPTNSIFTKKTNEMTVKVKHALLKDHKKSLPSTVSTALTWNLPCVTISAVLDVVEIISENVAAAMERAKQRCTCLPARSPCGVWPVHVPHHLLHLMSLTHTHINSHLTLLASVSR